MDFTKDKLLLEINNAAMQEKGLVASFRDLRFTFGFTRMDGKDILLTQLIFPSRSEMEIQMAPHHQIHSNIQDWCRENKISFGYDLNRDEYKFKGVSGRRSLSDKYRLMIYFAHSTMVMYSADIVSNDKMTVAEFREQNQDVCRRVFEEALSVMNYELSDEQMSRACYVYLTSTYFPQSVKNTKAYKPL